MVRKAYAERLKAAIEGGPATQKAIADYCGVSEQAVGRWKRNGHIAKENMEKVAEITGYSFLWLMTGRGERKYDCASRKKEKDAALWYDEALLNQTFVIRLLGVISIGLKTDALCEESIDRVSEMLDSFIRRGGKS